MNAISTRTEGHPLELSIVMPCFNEADTVATCVSKAVDSIRALGIEGEVIVADNGSTDGSAALAAAAGARVVAVTERGYGAALMSGIAAARGASILMGDADDSYDFTDLAPFVRELRRGADLVQGCRLPVGGGVVSPRSMPFLHRHVGNPFFSWLARRWFGAPVHDIYCGMRGFRRDLYNRLNQRCTGMEFATEMVIKASLLGARIAEVPITLYPDGRKAHKPHLRTLHDGWRTLRFFLLCSPSRVFVGPGVFLIVLGLVGYLLAMPAVTVGTVTFDAHTLLVASLALVTGYQSVTFGFFARVFAATEALLPPSRQAEYLQNAVTLERGIAAGLLLGGVGAALILRVVVTWAHGGFGRLDYAATMRLVVPGVTLSTLAVQTVLSCFFLSVLALRRR